MWFYSLFITMTALWNLVQIFCFSYLGNTFLYFADDFHNFNTLYYEDVIELFLRYEFFPENYTEEFQEYMKSHYRVIEDYISRDDPKVKWKYRYFVEQYPIKPPTRFDKFWDYELISSFGLTVGVLIKLLFAGFFVGVWWLWINFIWSDWRHQR